MRRTCKRLLMITAALVLLFSSFIWLTDVYVQKQTKAYLYDSIEAIPENHVGLLLGTSKYLKGGRINLYYQNRIDAAAELIHHKKVAVLLASGDNRQKEYNEPETMKQDLIRAGVPANQIVLDYAGFRTLDSVIRAREVFGQERFTVISQQFHNERAIFIAQTKGMDVIGYNARDVHLYHGGFKTQLREKFARVKMMLDLVFEKEPYFLGEKIIIP